MQMATSIETDNGEMIVKRVSVPIGLEELMEGLTKEVILKKPKDIYVFASEYFANLLNLREKGSLKVPGRKAHSVTKQIPSHVEKHFSSKTKSVDSAKHLQRQKTVRSDSPAKRSLTTKKIILNSKEEKDEKKNDKTKTFLDKRKARKNSKENMVNNKKSEKGTIKQEDKNEKKTPRSKDRSSSESNSKISRRSSDSIKSNEKNSSSKTNIKKSSPKSDDVESNEYMNKNVVAVSSAVENINEGLEKSEASGTEEKPTENVTCVGCSVTAEGAVDKVSAKNKPSELPPDVELIEKEKTDTSAPNETHDLDKEEKSEHSNVESVDEIDGRESLDIENASKRIGDVNADFLHNVPNTDVSNSLPLKEEGILPTEINNNVSNDEETTENVTSTSDAVQDETTVKEVNKEDTSSTNQSKYNTNLDNLESDENKLDEDNMNKKEESAKNSDEVSHSNILSDITDINEKSGALELGPKHALATKDQKILNENEEEDKENIYTEEDTNKQSTEKVQIKEIKNRSFSEGKIDIIENQDKSDKKVKRIKSVDTKRTTTFDAPKLHKELSETSGANKISTFESSSEINAASERSVTKDTNGLSEVAKEISAAIKLQSLWRGFSIRKQYQKKPLVKEDSENSKHEETKDLTTIAEEISAAIKLQSVWRGFSIRKQYRKKRSITEVSENSRNNDTRDLNEIAKEISAAIKLQSIWRGFRIRKQYQKKHPVKKSSENSKNEATNDFSEIAKEISAAIKLQAIWRGFCIRKQYQKKQLVKEESENNSKNKETKDLTTIAEEISAAIKLQSVWRGFSIRKHYQKKKPSKEATENSVSKEINDFSRVAREIAAARKIQSMWRKFLIRKQNHKKDLVKESAQNLDEIKSIDVKEITDHDRIVPEDVIKKIVTSETEAPPKKDHTKISEEEQSQIPNNHEIPAIEISQISNESRNETPENESAIDTNKQENANLSNVKGTNEECADQISIGTVNSEKVSSPADKEKTEPEANFKTETDTKTTENEQKADLSSETNIKHDVEEKSDLSTDQKMPTSKIEEVHQSEKSETSKEPLKKGVNQQSVIEVNEEGSVIINEYKKSEISENKNLNKNVSSTKHETAVSNTDTDSSEKSVQPTMADAVLKIQSLWRGFKVRKQLQNRSVFGTVVDKELKNIENLELVKRNDKVQAASKIQALWKGYKVRKNIKDAIDKLAQIQKPEECDEMPHQRGLSDEDISKAATKIQAGMRGYMVRKKRSTISSLKSIEEESSPDTKLIDEDVLAKLEQLQDVPRNSPELSFTKKTVSHSSSTPPSDDAKKSLDNNNSASPKENVNNEPTGSEILKNSTTADTKEDNKKTENQVDFIATELDSSATNKLSSTDMHAIIDEPVSNGSVNINETDPVSNKNSEEPKYEDAPTRPVTCNTTEDKAREENENNLEDNSHENKTLLEETNKDENGDKLSNEKDKQVLSSQDSSTSVDSVTTVIFNDAHQQSMNSVDEKSRNNSGENDSEVTKDASASNHTNLELNEEHKSTKESVPHEQRSKEGMENELKDQEKEDYKIVVNANKENLISSQNEKENGQLMHDKKMDSSIDINQSDKELIVCDNNKIRTDSPETGESKIVQLTDNSDNGKHDEITEPLIVKTNNNKMDMSALESEIRNSNKQLQEMVARNSEESSEKSEQERSQSIDVSTTDDAKTENSSCVSENQGIIDGNKPKVTGDWDEKSQEVKGEKDKLDIQIPIRELCDIREEETETKSSLDSVEDLEDENKSSESRSIKKVTESEGKITEESKNELIKGKGGHEEEKGLVPSVTVQHTEKEITNNGTNDNEVSKKSEGPTISLVHSGEFHDAITVPIPVTPPSRTSSGGSEHQTKERQMSPPGLVHTGELHDNVLPLSVQLNDASPAGAEILTSHVSKSLNNNGQDRAQASNKDASTCETQSDNRTLSASSMETEKRNNSTMPKKNMEAEAATKIQAGFRGYQVRKQLKNKISSPGDISHQRRSARRKSSGRITDSGRIIQNKQKITPDGEIEEKSAVKIQAGVRGFLVRRRQKKQKQGKESS